MARRSILLLSEASEWSSRVLGWRDAFDVYRCSTSEEARALLTGSRPWAVMLIDGANHGADRDLIALAARRGASPVVVQAAHVPIDWVGLGAHALLSPNFDREALEEALGVDRDSPSPGRVEHPLLCVTGPGGTGASTVSIALSQGLAARPSRVLLADFRRNAELHVLHDLDGDGPSIADLAEAHRTASADSPTLSQLPLRMPRGYRLLAGLRRSVGWSSLRPAAVAAAVDALRAAYDVVVCDVDPDLEGEADGGSVDVEERNVLARTAVAQAAAVVVVGSAGAKGAHSLLRVMGELWSHGVSPERTVAVVNKGDSGAVELLKAALSRLGVEGSTQLALPELPLERLIIAGADLPDAFVEPITAAVAPLLDGGPRTVGPEPERITPGSLGLRGSGDGAG